jgi:hypothetical protein
MEAANKVCVDVFNGAQALVTADAATIATIQGLSEKLNICKQQTATATTVDVSPVSVSAFLEEASCVKMSTQVAHLAKGMHVLVRRPEATGGNGGVMDGNKDGGERVMDGQGRASPSVACCTLVPSAM